jgi:hypothetical protein
MPEQPANRPLLSRIPDACLATAVAPSVIRETTSVSDNLLSPYLAGKFDHKAQFLQLCIRRDIVSVEGARKAALRR